MRRRSSRPLGRGGHPPSPQPSPLVPLCRRRRPCGWPRAPASRPAHSRRVRCLRPRRGPLPRGRPYRVGRVGPCGASSPRRRFRFLHRYRAVAAYRQKRHRRPRRRRRDGRRDAAWQRRARQALARPVAASAHACARPARRGPWRPPRRGQAAGSRGRLAAATGAAARRARPAEGSEGAADSSRLRRRRGAAREAAAEIAGNGAAQAQRWPTRKRAECWTTPGTSCRSSPF